MSKTINRDRPIFWMVLSGVLAGVAIGALAGNGLDVFADNLGQQPIPPPGNGQGPLVVPYDGYLMLDNAPIDGSESLTFHLHTGDACTDCEVWSETQDVTFTSGRFSVGLGSVAPISNAVLANDALFLSIDVNGTPLAGRQAIEAVPYAAWAGNADDFRVNGDARMLGNVHIGQGNPADGLPHLRLDNPANTDATIDTLDDFSLSLWTGNDAVSSYGLGIQSRTMFYHVPGNASHDFYTGGTRRMELSSAGLNVEGDLTVDNDLTVTNDLTVDNLTVANRAVLGNMSSDTHSIIGTLSVLGPVNATEGLDVTGSLNVSQNIVSGGFLTTNGNLNVNGELRANDLLRFHRSTTAPASCTASLVGAAYMDTSIRGDASTQLLCVCLRRSGTYAWREAGSIDAACD